MTNRYYILPYPNLNSSVWNIIVGTTETQRLNVQGNKVVVKLPLGDIKQHAILNGIQEYTHVEILVEMAKSTWTQTEIL